MLSDKFCECGCGKQTNIAARTYSGYGIVRGAPLRFIKNHYQPHSRGKENHRWNGGTTIGTRGYRFIACPEHPRADQNGYIQEHIVIAEKALGRFLPGGAQIHHVNKLTSDNRNANLVICQNQAYHLLLHVRAKAVEAGFPAHWRKCKSCKRFDALENFYIRPSGRGYIHPSCQTKYRREYKEKTGR